MILVHFDSINFESKKIKVEDDETDREQKKILRILLDIVEIQSGKKPNTGTKPNTKNYQ